MYVCRCIGPLNAAKFTECRGVASEIATIDPSLQRNIFRFAPLVGEEGTYRIILKDRKGKGCNRFLTAYEDCSTDTVGFASDDFGGLQRWVITKVDQNGDVTPSPPPPSPSPTPSPTSSSTPVPLPAPLVSAYNISVSSVDLEVLFPVEFRGLRCIIMLSPGDQSMTSTLSESSGRAIASFTRLSPGVTYTATSYCEVEGGIQSPSSRINFKTVGGIYGTPSSDSNSVCDGRGETVGNDGKCICDKPFVPTRKGGCACQPGMIDTGSGPCECTIMYSVCDSGCCPCANYQATARVSPSDFPASNKGGYFGSGCYGCSGGVAINNLGDVIAINDYNGFVEGNTNLPLPKAYVYTYDGSEWNEEIIALDEPRQLGSSKNSEVVSTALNADGDLLAVGSMGWKADQTQLLNVGAVWVYRKVDGEWTFQQRFDPSEFGLEFGASVSMNKDGSVITVGDHFHKDPNNPSNSEGRLTVYRFDGSEFVEEFATTSSNYDGTNPERFGQNVISGDGLTIVAKQFSYGSTYYDGGIVYALKYRDSQWIETQQLTASGSVALGYSVATNHDGSIIIAGDPNVDEGRVHIFKYNNNTEQYYESDVLQGSDTVSNGKAFGSSVALNEAGDILLVGDPQAGSTESGKIYFFRYLNDNWTEIQDIAPEDFWDHTFTNFGKSLTLNGPGNIALVSDYDYSGPGYAYIFESKC